jgi:predicted ATPase/DNA-binding XRE family transcriptional regulator
MAGPQRRSDFGKQLQEWRHTERITQRELADTLGYDVTYIVKIEGGSRPPSRQFKARLAQVAGSEFLKGFADDLSRAPLPQPPDVLVGRDQEVEQLEAAVLGSGRCVTVVGPPGIGKTRVALEAASWVDTKLSGGSWWVSLLDVSSPDGVGQHIRRSLRVPRAGHADPVDALLERFASLEALLVLDNFEHVMAARGIVTRLLAGAPGLTVMVTSREALGLVSEQVFPVSALTFPDPAGRPPFDEVESSPAVQLFVTRAKMARPRFRLTMGNYDAVLTTCARMDGIPLAIVLAAGGVKVIGPAGMVRRLETGLDLADVAPTDMPAHHRTLENAIAASWQLLEGAEQALFAAVSIFADGFTAEAAAAVGDLGVDEAESLLSALARKSLIDARPDAPSGARFEMLPTIRSFALSRLEASGLAPRTQRRHGAYFAEFAERCGQGLTGHEQAQCVQVLAEEFANLDAAFDWAVENDPADAMRFAASLWRFFLISDIPTGRQWLERALAASEEPTAWRAMALTATGALGWVTGHFELSDVSLQQAADLAAELGLDDIAALASVNRGGLAEQKGLLDDADRWFSDAMRRYDSLGDRRGRAASLVGLGMIRRRRDDVAGAVPMWTEAAGLFRQVGDRFNETIALGNLAWAAEAEGRFDEARDWSAMCRRIQIALGDARGLAATTAALGRVAYKCGRLGEAGSLHLDALVGFRRLGDQPWAATTILCLAAVAEGQGFGERAAILLGAADALYEQIGARPRHDDVVQRDLVVERCRARLGSAAYARMFGWGRTQSVDEAAALAAGGASDFQGDRSTQLFRSADGF